MKLTSTRTKQASASTKPETAQKPRRKPARVGVSAVARKATHAAYRRSLKAGLDVHVIEGDTVYRVAPDGKRVAVKRVAPPVPVQPGSKRKLR